MLFFQHIIYDMTLVHPLPFSKGRVVIKDFDERCQLSDAWSPSTAGAQPSNAADAETAQTVG